jgi:hypothetical protein
VKDISSLHEFLQDVMRNADEARGARWVLQASAEYPQLAATLREYVTATPEQIVKALAVHYPEARWLVMMPGALAYIARLQLRLQPHFG